MRTKILGIFLIAVLFLAGCVKQDDIDNLQKQIDELEEQVAKNTEAIQKDLLQQIASLQSELEALSAKTDEDNEELNDLIAGLQASLDTISEDVENNAKSVFYGNLITDEDYAAYVEAGANVVTGKVVISTEEQADVVSNLRWVGQELISAVGTLEGIQNVGGDVIITSTDTVIDLKGMVSIGGDFMIPVNPNLKNVVADDLMVLAGELGMESGNEQLTSISMKNLQVVGSILLENNSDNLGGATAGPLTVIELNNAHVAGDLEMYYVVDKYSNTGTSFSIGQVDGDVIFDNCGIETVTIGTTTLRGDLSITNNNIKNFQLPDLTSVDGDVYLVDNYFNTSGGPVKATYVGLENFNVPKLAVISGDLIVEDNRLLGDVLNKLPRVDGDIVFYVKNTSLDVIAFESLESAGHDILVAGQLNSLTAFNALTTVDDYRSVSLGADLSPYNFLVVSNEMKVFNNLESANATLKVSRYFNSNGGLGTSFEKLSFMKNIYLYFFYRYDDLPDNSFASLKKVENLKVYGDKYKALDLDLSNSFANLDSITGTLSISNDWTSFTGLMAKNINKISYYNNIQYLGMPELVSLYATYGVTFQAYSEGMTLDFPKLEMMNKLTVKTREAGGDITVNMPVLDSCNQVVFDFYYYTPNSITAQLPNLTEVTKLTVKFKEVLDASELLTGLTTLGDNAYNRSNDVMIYYVTGQTFCGMSDFLNNLVNKNQLDRVMLYKDKKLVPASNETTEIGLLTSGC